jgi:hypothetical protein
MEGGQRRCRMCYEERETIEHMWNGCSEMREKEKKERGEILNEDEREIKWMILHIREKLALFYIYYTICYVRCDQE